MSRSAFGILLLAAITNLACAGLDVTPIALDQSLDNRVDGFRYYQSAPFLFIYSDGKGGLVSQIKFLPDTTQKMAIRPYAYFASNESTLQFDGGVLTQAAAVVDETVVPAGALDALAKVLGAAAKAALNAPEATTETTAPVPYIFKILLQKDKIVLAGGPANGAAVTPDGTTKMTIFVTVPKGGT